MAWEPDYATSEELTEFAHTDVGDASWVNLARSSASRAIDGACHRQFGQLAAPEARRYTARWSSTNGGWLVETADLMDLTGLLAAFDGAGDRTYSTVVDPTKVDWLPWDAAQRGRPYERALLRADAGAFDRRPGGFRFTARWGWSWTWPTTIDLATSLQRTVKEAALLQGSRLLMRRDSPFGIAGSPEAGSEKRLLAKVDPDVQVALEVGKLVRRVWAR